MAHARLLVTGRVVKVGHVVVQRRLAVTIPHARAQRQGLLRQREGTSEIAGRLRAQSEVVESRDLGPRVAQAAGETEAGLAVMQGSRDVPVRLRKDAGD